MTRRGRWAAAVLTTGVLVLSGCSSDSEGTDDTAAPSSTASSAPSTIGSASTPSESGSQSSGASTTAASSTTDSASAAADPASDLPSAVLSVTPATPTESVEIGVPGTAPPEDAPLSEECAGISTGTMAQWVGGPAFDAADDITIDPELGDSSCIFSTLTGTHSVIVERNALATYFGGELAALPEADAMTVLEEQFTLSATDPEVSSATVGGRAATVITATTLTGGSNGVAYTIVDGTLVVVTATGDELAATDGGLGGTATRVLEQVLAL